MKKIIYLAESAGIGGAQEMLRLLLENLDRDKISPEVILGEEGITEQTCKKLGIPCSIIKMPEMKPLSLKIGKIRVPSPAAFLYNIAAGTGYIIHLAAALKNSGADCLHTSSLLAEIFGSFAWLVSDRKQILIRHIHSIQPVGFRRKFAGVTARIFPGPLIAVSGAVAEIYRPFLRKNPDKISVIYNGIEDILPEQDKESNGKPGIRQEFNIPSGARLISNIGRIDPKKDQLTFIKAAEKVTRKNPNAVFVLAGGAGSGKQRKYFEKLHNAVKEKNLEGNIIFTGFYREGYKIFEESDIIVSTSLTESFGLAAVEGMRSGKPVIATALEGHLETVVDGETGFLIEPGRPDLLADKITYLLDNPAIRESMGEKGRKRFLEKFTVEKFKESINNFYDNL